METHRRQVYRDKMRDLGKVLRHKIMIQKMTTEYDEWENQVRVWTDWQEMWAKRSNLFGQTYYAAKVAGEENTVEFEVRDAPFMEELVHSVDEYQVVFGETEYVIKQVDPLRDGGGWVKLKCLERGVSGQSSAGQPTGE